jgi:hypothetical protein
MCLKVAKSICGFVSSSFTSICVDFRCGRYGKEQYSSDLIFTTVQLILLFLSAHQTLAIKRI